MDKFLKCILIACSILNCNGVDLREKWVERLQKANEEPFESYKKPSRRAQYDFRQVGSILGAPSMPSHLPEAEPILPGHTLLRPAMGMLKSSVKFPHKDMDNGAGVYGNVDHLGIKYDGRNERVLYSGFRRTRTPSDYIAIAPLKSKYPNQKFILSSVVLDLDRDKNIERKLLNALQSVKQTTYPKSIRIIQVYSKPQKTQQKWNLYNGYVEPKKSLRISDNNEQNHESSELGSAEPAKPVNDSLEAGYQAESKQSWFWNSKDAYNNIKINEEAPEHVELMPVNISNGIRNWWFYHQDDYQPFENNLE